MLKRVTQLFPWQIYLLIFGAAIVAVLLIVGRAQQLSVKDTIYLSVDQQLTEEAKSIRRQLEYIDRWNLEGYRNETIDFSMPSSYYWVVGSDGTIIDIEGTPPPLHGVKVPDEDIFKTIKTIATSSNENWRLAGKKVVGGWVVVGTTLPSNSTNVKLQSYDEDLKKTLLHFGSTLEQAKKISSRSVITDIDYVVVDDAGNFINGAGGVPIKIGANSFSLDDQNIRRVSLPVFNELQNQQVANIVLIKDISLEIAAVGHINHINNVAALIVALVTIVLNLAFIFPHLLRRQSHVTIEDAIKVGEGKHIEFKSTFQCVVGNPEKVVEKRLEILKAIAGFLNGDGGTLFIGIMEAPPAPPIIRGMPEDLEVVQNSTDVMRRTLTGLISDRIGKQYSDLINEHIEERDGKLCWVISVTRSPEPAFVRWKSDGETKEDKHFYVREGPRTADLDLENTWKYIKNRWKK